ALGALHILPSRMAVERISRFVEGDILGKLNRQILVRHRHHAAFLAVDDRNGAAPVTLARNAPVAQAKLNLALADRTIAARFALKTLRDFFLGFWDAQSVEEARIRELAIFGIGLAADLEGFRVSTFGNDDRRYRQIIFACKIQVALIVRGAA